MNIAHDCVVMLLVGAYISKLFVKWHVKWNEKVIAWNIYYLEFVSVYLIFKKENINICFG